MQSASAKAGQFSKLSIFDVVGEPALSSPFQAGGPQGAGPGTTYGYKKSDGPILAADYKARDYTAPEYKVVDTAHAEVVAEAVKDG